jgi:arginyl-tRNA synthetase
VAASPSKAGVGAPPAAVAYFGVDAVRFALAGAATPGPAAIERQLGLPLDLANPFVLIRYAHADAASTLRWAADLDLIADESHPAVSPGMTAVGLRPVEEGLIDVMSWLPERVAAAHRRRRPVDVVDFLENLAQAWLDCSERCSALPFRGLGAATAPGTVAVRLELAEAVSTTLAAGLGLLGVAAPAMM